MHRVSFTPPSGRMSNSDAISFLLVPSTTRATTRVSEWSRNLNSTFYSFSTIFLFNIQFVHIYSSDKKCSHHK
jgi:hypothetical protein